VQHGAGTRRLNLLGGLIHRMPVTTLCVLLGGACLAALPPSAGFAGQWILFQALLGAARLGGLGVQILVCVVALLMALAVALGAAAAIRLIGVAFLGRPRSPRAAAAEEAGTMLRAAMVGLAAIAALIGLFPGGVLRLAGPVLNLLLGGDLADRAGPMLITPQAEAAGINVPGYAALAVAILLSLVGGGGIVAQRRHAMRRGTSGHRAVPAWDCGFGAPPAWLPFGDPVTQYNAESFAQPLRVTLGASLLGAREVVDMPASGEIRAARIDVVMADPADRLLFGPLGRARETVSRVVDQMQFLSIRQLLAVGFLVLVLFLAAVAVVEQL
jgi:hypothetical protein